MLKEVLTGTDSERFSSVTLPLVLILLFGMISVSVAPAAEVVVDDFATAQAQISAPPTTASTADGAGILGAERDLEVSRLNGAGTVTGEVTGGALVFAAPASTRAQLLASWDGNDDDATTLDPNGLGGADLTDGGANNAIRFSVSAVTGNAEVVIEVFSDAANSSSAAFVAQATGDVILTFSGNHPDFSANLGAGADFTNVGAITMLIRTTSGSVTIGDLRAVPPAVTATKVDLDTSDVPLGGTPVNPGDTIRYRITITNTGGEATQVDLTDVIDANTTSAGTVKTTPIAFGDNYETFGGVQLSIAAAGVLANDGDPDGGTVSVTAFDAMSVQSSSNNVTVNADGSFTYDPPASFNGVDSFTYTIDDDEGDSANATVTIAVAGTVWFVDNSVAGPGTGTLVDPFSSFTPLNGAGGAGDVDSPNDIIYIRTGSGPTDTGDASGFELENYQQLMGEGVELMVGSATIVPAGSPPTLANTAGTSGPGITLAQNNTLRGFNIGDTAGAGILGSNFVTLNVDTVNIGGSGQAIDLDTGALNVTFNNIASSSSSASGIRLNALTGTFTVSNLGGTDTSISNPSGAGIMVSNSGSATFSFGDTSVSGTGSTGIDLASGNAGATFTFDSLSVTTFSGRGLFANNSGTVNVGGSSNTISATGGAAVDITGTSLGAGGFTFSSVSSSSSPGNGINLDTVSGSFTANGGSIMGATGIAARVNAGSSNITYSGTINNSANRSVSVTNRTGGTVAFSSNITDTGTGILVNSNSGGTTTFSGSTKTINTPGNQSVTLTFNSGHTINFTNGGLAITSTTAAGFTATNGGTVNVAGANNTVTSSTGAGVNIADTIIGASGVTFRSISSNGGSNPGIQLSNTGASGAFAVTGDGGGANNGSGGTIANKSGGIDGADGILLNNTQNVSLGYMNIDGNTRNGINGTSVTNLTLARCNIRNNADQAGPNEAGILLSNLLGNSAFTNILVENSFEDNVAIRNSSGILTLLSITSSTIQTNSAAFGNDGLLFEATGTANMTMSITNSTFADHAADQLQLAANGATSMNVTVDNVDFTNAHPAIVSGAGGITASAGGIFTGDASFYFNNNDISGAVGTALNVLMISSTAAGSLESLITNNRIGLSGDPGSASTQSDAINVETGDNGRHVSRVANNTIFQYSDRGIRLKLGNQPGGVNGGRLDVTVTGNSIAQPNGPFAREGIFLESGSSSGDTGVVCADIGGSSPALENAIVGSGGGGGLGDFRLNRRFTTAILLPGYGGPADGSGVVPYIQGRNSGTPTGAATGGATFTSGTCVTPSLP